MNASMRPKAGRALTQFVLACCLLTAGRGAADPGLSFEEGIARDPKGSVEFYREQHFLRSEDERPLERLVLYRCPGGVLFGRKRIDYRASALAPESADLVVMMASLAWDFASRTSNMTSARSGAPRRRSASLSFTRRCSGGSG